MRKHFSACPASEQGSTPTPHLCVLRPEEGESFGFDLSTGMKKHNGHVIRNVASGGVAQRSGLKGGDRILEVNNHYVDHLSCSEVKGTFSNIFSFNRSSFLLLSIKQVARKIKQSGQQLCLLVLDGEVYERALSRGEDLQSLAKTYKGGDLKPPRLCHITKHPDSGLGIYFAPLEGKACR